MRAGKPPTQVGPFICIRCHTTYFLAAGMGRGGRKYCDNCRLSSTAVGKGLCVHPQHEGERIMDEGMFYQRKGRFLSYCKLCYKTPKPKEEAVTNAP